MKAAYAMVYYVLPQKPIPDNWIILLQFYAERAYAAESEMSDSEKERLCEAFMKIDADGSGFIDASEVGRHTLHIIH